jgi:hypothetical protein
MTRLSKLRSALAALFAVALAATPASAANTRSFISAGGLDTNSCARTAPCRTLQVAYNNTNAGGEINMLDPAGYGPVTITHAISIVNDGVGSAGILVPSGGTGITISAGATDAVNLRGLIIEGAGVGQTGIQVTSVQSLNIQNCVIRHLTSNGIAFTPNASSILTVSNTLIADNIGGTAVSVAPTGAGINLVAAFDRVEVNNNHTGISAAGGGTSGVSAVNLILTDLLAANNTSFGIAAGSTNTGAATKMLVQRSTVVNSFIGLATIGQNGTIWLTQSTLTANNAALSLTNNIISYGDNTIIGNTNNGTPAGTLTHN